MAEARPFGVEKALSGMGGSAMVRATATFVPRIDGTVEVTIEAGIMFHAAFQKRWPEK